MGSALPIPEAAGIDEHRYHLTACLHHRPRNLPGLGLHCANPWCGAPLEEAPRENPTAGVRALLRSIRTSLDAQRRRLAHGDPLAVKGVRDFQFDPRAGFLNIDLGRNLVVVSGRRTAGRRTFSISGDVAPAAVQALGLDAATANPTEATTQFDATAANRSIKNFDAGYATITAQDASPVKVVCQSSWTEADNPGPKTFVVRRVGLAIGTANAERDLYSILGGTIPTVILELNFTGLTSFALKPQVEVTLTNESAQ